MNLSNYLVQIGKIHYNTPVVGAFIPYVAKLANVNDRP